MQVQGTMAGTVRAALWASGSAWFNGLFAAACWIITARFVSASEMGCYALASSWAALAALGLTSLALNLPVLHYGGEPGVVRTVAAVALAGSGLVFALAAALALLGIAPAPLVPMFAVLVTYRVIMTLALCLEAELERKLEFRLIAMNRTVASVVSCTLQAGLAWGGWGGWAIVIRELVSSIVFLATVLARVTGAMGGRVERRQVVRVLRTGAAFMPEQIFDRVAAIADGLVVAPLAGLATLGALVQLRTLAGYVRMTLVPFLIPVSRSAFASMRADPEARRRVREMMARFLLHVALPVSALFLAAPQALEDVLWGPNWAVATVALPAMAIQVVLGPLMELRLMEAVGCERPGLAALSRACSLAVYLGALVGLVPRLGSPGAALALGLAPLPGILLGARLGPLRFAARDAIPLVAAAVAAVACVKCGLPDRSLWRIPLVIGVYAALLGIAEGRWLMDQGREILRMAAGGAADAASGVVGQETARPPA